MRVHAPFFAAALLVLGAAPSLTSAQIRRMPSDGTSRRVRTAISDNDGPAPDPRTVLGLTVGTSGTDRDTLGLLVTQVLRDGPAERAGIDEGNRIAEIDGVSLRLDPADVGRSGPGDAAVRRLARTLGGLHDADQARLRVYSSGRYRTVTVQLAGMPNVATAATAGSVPLPAANVMTAGDPARIPSVTTAIQSIADLQAQLRRLADDQGGTPLGDSLAQSARDLSLIQRRLRDAQAAQRRRAEDMSDRSDSRRAGGDIPGLSVSAVSDDLADYFGDGSERGLLVLQAERSWDPIRPGDVILTVDGSPATVDRLRDAADPGRRVRIELLRRRRQTTVTLHDREDDR